MGWVDTESLTGPQRNWRQIRNHKKRASEGFQDITVEGLDVSVYPARKPLYRYELIQPGANSLPCLK